jgi:3-deoxy-D-manno-octulosonic-acid transferase
VFLLYNFLVTLFSPLWVPWMLWRSWRRKEKPNWQERTGNLPLVGKNAPPRIWFHAVSVGEVIAAKPILKEIRRLLPKYQIILSVTTSSGHQTARELSPPPFDTLVYFPIDVARFQLVAMQRVRPKAVVIMETELWMNFLWAAKVFDAKTILVNGRISDRSFPRSMKARVFYQALLKQLDLALMQSEVDRERIQALGAPHAAVLGSSKFDEALDSIGTDGAEWRKRLNLPQDAFVIVIGSTRGEFEERFVMNALEKVWDLGVWVIHAPRHIESCPGLLSAAQTRFSSGQLYSDPNPNGDRYSVVDVYGVLAQLYSVADVAIIGGGFENLGGQNVIQPLAQGKPVLHGPHMQNFRDPTALADRAGAAVCCKSPDELGQILAELKNDPKKRGDMGEAAKMLVQENLGASRRYAEAVRDALAGSK